MGGRGGHVTGRGGHVTGRGGHVTGRGGHVTSSSLIALGAPIFLNTVSIIRPTNMLLTRDGWNGMVGTGWMGRDGWNGMVGTGWLERDGWNGMVGTGWLERDGWNGMVGTGWMQRDGWNWMDGTGWMGRDGCDAPDKVLAYTRPASRWCGQRDHCGLQEIDGGKLRVFRHASDHHQSAALQTKENQC